MTWPEPLAARTRDTDAGYNVIITAGDGTRVAGLQIDVYGAGRRKNALCGALRITDNNGAARQRVRALALLMREALRHAVELGVVYARADATPDMVQLAKRVTGHQPRREQPVATTIFTGKIIDWWQHASEATDGDGNVL